MHTYIIKKINTYPLSILSILLKREQYIVQFESHCLRLTPHPPPLKFIIIKIIRPIVLQISITSDIMSQYVIFLVTIAYDLILLLINTGENVTFLRLTIATTNRRGITLVNIDLPFILQIRPYQENVNIFCKKNCIGMSKKKPSGCGQLIRQRIKFGRETPAAQPTLHTPIS